MNHFVKHDLDFSVALEFVVDNLEETNFLSVELLKSLDFMQGRFFTFLPSSNRHIDLHKFFFGLQNVMDDSEVSYKSLLNRYIDFILEKSRKKFLCVIDDVLQRPNDKFHPDVFHIHGSIYKEEIYYLLEGGQMSKNAIHDCLMASNSIWHSLCIITKTNTKNLSPRLLTLDNIRDMCLNTEAILVGAYDGEGYVGWERS